MIAAVGWAKAQASLSEVGKIERAVPTTNRQCSDFAHPTKL
jgi:hypothetical protein